MLSQKLRTLVDSTQKLIHRGALGNVKKIIAKTHSADIAVIFRFFDDRSRAAVFSMLNDKSRAEVASELDPLVLQDFLPKREPAEVAAFLKQMDSDDEADVIRNLPEEFARRVMELLKPKEFQEVTELLRYGHETAGGIMTPALFSLSQDETAGDAVKALQSAKDLEMAFYVYVTDEQNRLVGVISLRQLVTTPAKTKLREIMMTEAVRVRTDTDQEEVARIVARYNLLAVPVTDEQNRLLGIVTVDDVIDVMREEATEDMLKMSGTAPVIEDTTSPIKRTWFRLPWLIAPCIAGLFATIVMNPFEPFLKTASYLAFFLPVVMGMAGNVGSQSAVLVVRGLATGRLDSKIHLIQLGRDMLVGLLLGLAYGTLVGSVAVFQQSLRFGIAVSVSMTCAMTLAALLGSLVPIIFEKLHIDPAVATGPLVTSILDLTTVLIYFSISIALLRI